MNSEDKEPLTAWQHPVQVSVLNSGGNVPLVFSVTQNAASVLAVFSHCGDRTEIR